MSNTPPIDMEEINRWLQRGDKKKIAEELQVDYGWVTKVLAGKYVNYPIIEKAIALATERKARIMEGMAKLRSI